jgi:hypothetical protein
MNSLDRQFRKPHHTIFRVGNQAEGVLGAADTTLFMFSSFIIFTEDELKWKKEDIYRDFQNNEQNGSRPHHNAPVCIPFPMFRCVKATFLKTLSAIQSQPLKPMSSRRYPSSSPVPHKHLEEMDHAGQQALNQF